MSCLQAVPLRAQRAALRQEQGGGRDEAGPRVHHRAHDQRGGVGRPDLARQLDQRHAGSVECPHVMYNAGSNMNRLLISVTSPEIGTRIFIDCQFEDLC